jgi:hypothetical protein
MKSNDLMDYVAFGSTRIGTRKLSKDMRYTTDKGAITLKQNCIVDVVEVYRDRKDGSNPNWYFDSYLWDTLRPVDGITSGGDVVSNGSVIGKKG